MMGVEKVSNKLQVLKSGTGVFLIDETNPIRRLCKYDPELVTNISLIFKAVWDW